MEPDMMERSGASTPGPIGRRRARGLGIVLAGAAIVGLTVSGSVAFAASPTAEPTAGTTPMPSAVPLDPAAADAAFAKFAACMRDHGVDMPDPVTVRVDVRDVAPLGVGAQLGGGTSPGGEAPLDSAPLSGGTSFGGGAPLIVGAPVTGGEAGLMSSGTIVAVGPAQAVALPVDDAAFQAANAACAPILEAAGIKTAGPGSSLTVTGGANLPGSVSGGAPFGGGVVGIAVAGGDVTAQARDMKAYAVCMRSHGVDLPDPVVDTKAGTVQLSFSADPASAAFRSANAACATGSFELAAPAGPASTPEP